MYKINPVSGREKIRIITKHFFKEALAHFGKSNFYVRINTNCKSQVCFPTGESVNRVALLMQLFAFPGDEAGEKEESLWRLTHLSKEVIDLQAWETII